MKAVAGLSGAGHRSETQYHVHITLKQPDDDWEVAINVGTNDTDYLRQYKLVYDFHRRSLARLRWQQEALTI